jgi:hypothetical protein
MVTKPNESVEPTVVALIDAVTAWQGALDQTLSASGLTYAKLLLLRAMLKGEFERGSGYRGAVFVDAKLAEHLLRELHADGWVQFVDALDHPCVPDAANARPTIAEPVRARLGRIEQSVKALHSVSAAPFSADERATLGLLLQRMKETLNDHRSRQERRPCDGLAAAPCCGPCHEALMQSLKVESPTRLDCSL